MSELIDRIYDVEAISKQIADIMTKMKPIKDEIEKYPAAYWKLANPVTMYDFGQLPGNAGSAVQAGGVSMNDEKQIWNNG